MAFRFDQVGRALDSHTGTVPPKSFLPNDAKSRFSDGSDALHGYMPGYSTLLEIFASRYFFILNACDYEYESVLTMVMRPVGWGCRFAFYASSVLFLIMAYVHERNPLFEYSSFSRERDDEGTLQNDPTDIFEWFVTFVYGVWCVAIVTEVLSYMVGRGGGARPYAGQCSAFPFVLFNRTAISGNYGRCCMFAALLVFYTLFACAAAAAMRTVIAHMFITRNVYFAITLGAFTAFQLLAALADAVSLGGVDGLAVMNRPASWLASLRMIVLQPILVITSVALILMCFPTYA